ncbi:pyridoxamine 5'-phosphate oxidase family protein [Brevibacillus laterosporus]|uniref:Pyridoxamine 5'-phosphate oxidase family protein n=1 Tax=Brevibacillus laterosporus TaxID=1465 RepID=A0A502IP43_BRELA|nr:pyridoxamine 5'-phosphate oxidase family protein [Brevibacillus laterosporus]QDX94274.1 pyridoxamine 5'-phosphate oxidase family protein [Brevibacillus laterosporus]RAP31141.1 hypothetical protein C2W64_00313 [Brevibacillus laterosporus]TPG68211.1 pyridoxamine 5'-phosphate oxidase family protein [Brevibacillus laterosporus]TPG88661.1 pyridoxamine 5'-phosphate oxidase family protein [Brevibacillus laterosporus]
MKPFRKAILTEEELRNLTGTPGPLASNKVIPFLDIHCRSFLAKSPFLLLSTSSNKGLCDASPRGDHPGFVHVLDEHHLLIPERPGNRRVDSLRNIIANPYVGLLFMIPGLEETLRINGKAWVIQDQELLEPMQVQGRIPQLGIAVEVEECFIHCAKSFKRSGLWEPTTWLPKDSLPKPAVMLAEHAKLPNVSAEDVADLLHDSYTKRMY